MWELRYLLHLYIYSILSGNLSSKLSDLQVHFYRAMHFNAKRGIAIACRLSVRPSVCNVGELWSHRLEFFENNFTIS